MSRSAAKAAILALELNAQWLHLAN